MRSGSRGFYPGGHASKSINVRLFPRMEKLVRRHFFRKEPGHLACRAGLFAYAFCLLIATLPTLEAQNLGSPAKVVRGVAHAMDRAAIGVSSPSDSAREPAEFVEPAGTTAQVAAVSSRPAQVVTGPYLPITGALPLRFSSSRKWPTPRRETDAIATDEPANVANAQTLATTTPTVASNNIPEAIAPQNSAATTTAQSALLGPASEQQPARTAPEPTMLSADMVLGYLGNLPPVETRVSVRFEPAIPQSASVPSSGVFSP